MNRLACACFVLVLGGCGGGSAASSGTTTTPPPSGGDLCPGWVPARTPGGTSFALPGPIVRSEVDHGVSLGNGDTDVYIEVVEHQDPGFAGGSDRVVIEGVLAGLGDPRTASLAAGWSVVSQQAVVFRDRPTAERVIDIQGAVIRTERVVRAGPSVLLIITMVRRDHAATNPVALGCFERSLVFGAPASP